MPQKTLKVLLQILFTIGAVLTLSNTLLVLKGSKLCHSEGCLIVDSFARNDFVLNLFGAILFLTLFVLYRFRFYVGVSFLLSLALVVEGYLVGFQIFVLGKICHYCFGIFLILLTSNVLFLLENYLKGRNVSVNLFGFCGFLAILFITWFVNPSIKPLPKTGNVLIYSPKCPHCRKVLDFCQKENVNIAKVEANKEKGLLYALGITEVPVLLHRGNNNLKILWGDRNIEKFLSSKNKNLFEFPLKIQNNYEGSCNLLQPEGCR